jgi:hypothetical protein
MMVGGAFANNDSFGAAREKSFEAREELRDPRGLRRFHASPITRLAG